MNKVMNWQADGRAASFINVAARAMVMLLPTVLLVGASLRAPAPQHWMLWIGTGIQIAVCLLCFFNRGSWHESISPSVITLYLIALCWLWWAGYANDWYISMGKAILILVPLAAFAYQTLSDSGAPAIRRARLLADRLASRKDWPNNLAAIRSLPEVKALRAALHFDASPALALLEPGNIRTDSYNSARNGRNAAGSSDNLIRSAGNPIQNAIHVRVAALCALEFRKEWKPGQAELVLQTAQRAEQPIMRAAGVCALASVDDRELVERVATFLHDPSQEVRRAAVESLLWDTESRWSWIRFAVRRALADPLFQHDGALWQEGQQLSPEAVNDLRAWTAEKGVLGSRAALTLGSHYNRLLSERSNANLIESLREDLGDRSTPSVLRIEIGRVLQYHQELDDVVLEQMMDAANSAPLRMIAIETILSEQNSGRLHTAAVAALKDLARLPNREIAMTTASLIQRRLGVDLGLGLGQELPALHTRQAAEISRRVMLWATREGPTEKEEEASLV